MEIEGILNGNENIGESSAKGALSGKCVTLKLCIRKKATPISKFPCQECKKQIQHKEKTNLSRELLLHDKIYPSTQNHTQKPKTLFQDTEQKVWKTDNMIKGNKVNPIELLPPYSLEKISELCSRSCVGGDSQSPGVEIGVGRTGKTGPLGC